MESTTIIGFLFTLLGAVIGFLGYKRSHENDLKKESSENAFIQTKLDYIGRGVDDIRLDIKTQATKINELSERLIMVEESTKSAHKRLDEIN